MARMSCGFRDGRPESSAKILASTSRVRPSPESTAANQAKSETTSTARRRRSDWSEGERGVWTRRDKGARALRGFQGCVEAGVHVEDVAEYTVYDERSHEVIANVGVRGKSGKDPSFTAKIDGPRDIITRIICRKTSSVCRPNFGLFSVVPVKVRQSTLSDHVGKDSCGEGVQRAGQAVHHSNPCALRCRGIKVVGCSRNDGSTGHEEERVGRGQGHKKRTPLLAWVD